MSSDTSRKRILDDQIKETDVNEDRFVLMDDAMGKGASPADASPSKKHRPNTATHAGPLLQTPSAVRAVVAAVTQSPHRTTDEPAVTGSPQSAFGQDHRHEETPSPSPSRPDDPVGRDLSNSLDSPTWFEYWNMCYVHTKCHDKHRSKQEEEDEEVRLLTFNDKTRGVRRESIDCTFVDASVWTNTAVCDEPHSMAVQANPDFSALNTSTRLLQKGSAPVSLPMLSHLALRGSTTNAIFSPQFNARHVSLGNILSGSGGRPSMKDTVYASANDKQFLGFDATDMGIVVYSLHEFAESPDSYHDLLSKCRQVGGAPLVSLSKVSAPDENGEQDHFTLYCDTCCAVPVTIDAVNTLRRVLGCGHMVTEGPVTLSDIQGLFASMSKLDLTTVSAYRTFCEERRIPFPIPDQHNNRPTTHAEVCRAFTVFLQKHVNLFVACFEGNHRLYTSAIFREGWLPSMSVPHVTADYDDDYLPVPADSRINVDVMARIAFPLTQPGDDPPFGLDFMNELKNESKTTLRAGNTAIKPTFKSFVDTLLFALRDVIDSSAPVSYLNVDKYIAQDYSVSKTTPDLYIRFRSSVLNAVTRASVKRDPFLENEFRCFRGNAVKLDNLRTALLQEYGSTYQEPIVLTKTNRPYPDAVKVFVHLLLYVMFTESGVRTVERYMETCTFSREQSSVKIDMHDVAWLLNRLIKPSIVVSEQLRDKLLKGKGWAKMKKSNETKTLRPCMKKVSLLIHANFISSVMEAVSLYGPSPLLCAADQPLLHDAIVLGLYGCSSWIEIVLIHYYDFLKDFIDANIVVRAPTTAGKFDPHGVSFDTFALAHDYQPVQLFADILDGTVLFNPASLLRAVEKEKKRLADLKEKHSEQQDDGSGSDTPSGTAQQDQGQKKTRPPPLQPAFERLLKSIEKAFVRKDYDRAHRLLKLLKDIKPILKVTRDNKSEHTISNVASLYIDKAYKKSKAKPAKPKTDNSDDNDSTGAPHDDNHNDDPSASDAEGGEHDMESLD